MSSPKRTLSKVAQVAKICRQYLKDHGIKGSVKTKTYSQGNSVTITLIDPRPGVASSLKSKLAIYQTEGYKRREDIPQTAFLFVESEFDKDLQQLSWSFIRNHYNLSDSYPENCQSVGYEMTLDGEYVLSRIRSVLAGSSDLSANFWSLHAAMR